MNGIKMELTEVRKALIGLLKMSGAEDEMIVGTLLMLEKSEDAQERLLLWIDDLNPKRERLSPETLAEIVKETVRLHDSLPKEQQTAERIQA